MSEIVEDIQIETISKKELKSLTTASNLVNGSADSLQDAEFKYDGKVTSPTGFDSYVFENTITEDMKKIGKNSFFYTPAVSAGVEINDDTTFQPLFRMLLEQMGDNDEIQVPTNFKIVKVEDAMYTNSKGVKVKRYPLHFYKEFDQEMEDKGLDITGLYGRGAANREFFAGAKDWSVKDEHAANPDATVKKISIQII